MNSESPAAEESLRIPLSRVAAFVRQITHDVRNGLNAIDLQSAFISEIATDPEVVAELGKLRGMVGHVTKSMQDISARFGELRPMLMDYPVKEFVMGLRETVAKELESHVKRLRWEVNVPEEEEIELDYSLLTTALVELVRNAIYFREGEEPIEISIGNEGNALVFQTAQRRAQAPATPEQWGREPLLSSRRGGYGLGLYYVRRILEPLGGTLDARFEPEASLMKVRLSLPRKPGAED